jgi:drug/metabolite transporter (DMT)-like permease
MFLWNYAFATLEAGVASLTFFAQPVVGAALGTTFLGEKLTPLFFLGAGLIGLGLWLSSSNRPLSKSKQARRIGEDAEIG